MSGDGSASVARSSESWVSIETKRNESSASVEGARRDTDDNVYSSE